MQKRGTGRGGKRWGHKCDAKGGDISVMRDAKGGDCSLRQNGGDISVMNKWGNLCAAASGD
eukprot:9568912-Prorocentrum_lima.AAC.1